MYKEVLYYGSIVHSLSLTEIEYVLNALIFVENGRIGWIEKNVHPSDLQDTASKYGLSVGGYLGSVEIIALREGEFLCPGFVDTHTHAPQYPNLGLGQQYQLLDWLDNLTFPTESKFKDVQYAKAVYEEVVKRNLHAGTTTCSYYGTLHPESTKILAEIVFKHGQRALIGKCNMDRNCPSHYREPSASQSISDTKDVINYIRSLPVDLEHDYIKHLQSHFFHHDQHLFEPKATPLVQPCVTPRFALSCSEELLEKLKVLVEADQHLHIQTHLAENTAEIQQTLETFKGCQTYTGVYEKYGLLRKGTILAHCVWLSDQELEAISKSGAGISHCPTSNLNLKSGGARVGAMLDAGIEVGLGSDCSGGFALGVLPQLRNASMLSKLLALDKPNSSDGFAGKSLSIPTLFHMATLGGASVCNMADQIGNFEPGKDFDALRISVGRSPNFFYGVGEKVEWNEQKLKEAFERFLFVSDDRDIEEVWVRGRRVAGRH